LEVSSSRFEVHDVPSFYYFQSALSQFLGIEMCQDIPCGISKLRALPEQR
jgi:hypothetical protein